MDQKKIIEEFTEILRDVLDQPTLVITPETTAADVEKWDSLNHIFIVVATEKRFNIKINTAEVEEVRNVGELVQLIERKLGKA